MYSCLTCVIAFVKSCKKKLEGNKVKLFRLSTGKNNHDNVEYQIKQYKFLWLLLIHQYKVAAMAAEMFVKVMNDINLFHKKVGNAYIVDLSSLVFCLLSSVYIQLVTSKIMYKIQVLVLLWFAWIWNQSFSSYIYKH